MEQFDSMMVRESKRK